MTEITGLLLAAGSGSRFGGDKLLQTIGDKPLVLHSAASLIACDRLLAVVRSEDHALQAILHAAGIEWVINHAASQGMGRSIACGVHASVDSDGWCILPADMPYVKVASTAKLVERLHHGADLVAPYYHGRRGHPVGFGRRFMKSLMALDGDEGAHSILAAQADSLIAIAVEDPGIHIDIDRPEDLMP